MRIYENKKGWKLKCFKCKDPIRKGEQFFHTRFEILCEGCGYERIGDQAAAEHERYLMEQWSKNHPNEDFTETGIVVDGLYHQYHIDWFGIPRYLLKDGQYSNRICLIPTEIKDFQALIDPELLATLETFGLKLKWIDIVILAKTFYLMNDNQYAETDPIFASQVRPKPAITFRNLPPWVH
jgi:hypothetical protein